MILTPELILKVVKAKNYSPLKRKELAQKLKIPAHLKKRYHDLLKDMVKDGTLTRIKSNRYALPSSIGQITGTLSANEKGFGFIILDDETKDDIFVPPSNMGTALDGDKVLIRLVDRGQGRPKRGQGKEKDQPSQVGQIVEVVERNSKPLIGTLEQTERFYYVFPDNPKIKQDIYVDKKDLKKAKLGDKVIVSIVSWQSPSHNPEGIIKEVLGKTGDPWVDFRTILIHNNLSDSFPQSVEDQVKAIPNTINPKEIASRTDFRKDVVLTIDPDDAKDFDDAISLKKLENGHFELAIHIADVSHYVLPGTDLDKEAAQRGTSVYLPGKVIPMLPEKLSNNLCSLKPDETRLVKSVVVEFSKDGSVLKSSFHNGVIHSKKRFTYKEVLEIVENKNKALRDTNKETTPTLDLMAELADTLTQRRVNRGSIQLDIPSVKIRLNKEGKPTSIEKEVQDKAHIMIEEFMLTANELVAKKLTERGFPCIFRVHAPPKQESLNDFIELVKALGFKIPPVTTSKHIQQFLDTIIKNPEAKNIHYQLLRSLNRAEYSAKNIGHYALALKDYAHFTSPIRRYPDLEVHRFLDRLIKKEKKPSLTPVQLEAIAKHCSIRERAAQEAEYEAVDLKKLEYLKEQIEKKNVSTMKAVIRTIMPRGFFVETTDWLVDGFVPASSLTDDFYEADAKKFSFVGTRSRKSYKVGQEIRVKPVNIDLSRKKIDFKIV